MVVTAAGTHEHVQPIHVPRLEPADATADGSNIASRAFQLEVASSRSAGRGQQGQSGFVLIVRQRIGDQHAAAASQRASHPDQGAYRRDGRHHRFASIFSVPNRPQATRDPDTGSTSPRYKTAERRDQSVPR